MGWCVEGWCCGVERRERGEEGGGSRQRPAEEGEGEGKVEGNGEGVGCHLGPCSLHILVLISACGFLLHHIFL